MIFKTGDVIFKGHPFAFALLTNETRKRCDHCFTILKCPFDCFKCQSVFYCSRNCQRNAFSEHDGECSILSQRPLSMMTRLMVRILNKLKQDEVVEDICGRPRRWADLMDHYEDVIHDAGAMHRFNDIIQDLEKIFQEPLDIKSIISVYGKVLVNSFAIQDELLRPIGRAVYLGASVFDHSCNPNANFIFVGKTIYIKAIKDIDGDPFHDIRICYLDELDTYQERQDQLLSTYYFECDCERCRSSQFDKIPVSQDLVDLRDDLEILGLDSLSVALMRYRHECLSFDEVLERILGLVVPEAQKEARSFLIKLKSLEDEVMPLTDVVTLRLADLLLSLLPPDRDRSDLHLTVLSMIEKYYGKNHPRSVLQMIRTALLLEDDNTKIRLLNRALSVTQVFMPSSTEGNHTTSDVTLTCQQQFPTLLTVIESLLHDVQEGIKCEALIKNKKSKWKKEQIMKAPPFRGNFFSRGFFFPSSLHVSHIRGLKSSSQFASNRSRFGSKVPLAYY